LIAPRLEHAGRFVALGLAAALLGFAGVALGVHEDVRQAAFSYLFAYAFTLSLSLGALTLVMTGHAAGASWLVPIRRPLEALAAAIPLHAILFVPIAASLPELYPWARPHAPTPRDGFLEPGFFLARSAFYLGVWSLLGLLLWRGGPRARAVSAVGFPALGLTVMFAAFDWLMSLEPEWSSTIYGATYWAGGVLAALALAQVVAFSWQRRGLLTLSPSHHHAIGKLLLTLVIFWAYLSFAQALIVWIANIPRETAWYLARTQGGAGLLLVAIGLGKFAVPFFALLSRSVKRRGDLLALVSGTIILAHALDVSWLVFPALGGASPGPHALDVAALAAVLGTTLAGVGFLLRGVTATPVEDPDHERGSRYETT
jgi:hypothetical protein